MLVLQLLTDLLRLVKRNDFLLLQKKSASNLSEICNMIFLAGIGDIMLISFYFRLFNNICFSCLSRFYCLSVCLFICLPICLSVFYFACLKNVFLKYRSIFCLLLNKD